MKQRPFPALLAILILSVLLRVLVALYLGNEVDAPPLLTDQRSYHALGARLIEGHGFSFDRNWYPFTPADTPTSHWSFLYSLLVAGVYSLFGPNPLAMRLVQAVVGGLLLPWMVYRLAVTLFSGSARKEEAQPGTIALVAAFVTAVHGYFVLYAATLMTETMFLITLLWSLERGLAFSHRLSAGESLRSLWPLGLALGFSLGLATLIRQSILPWVPVLMLYLLALGWRKSQLRTAVVAMGSAGLILVAFVVPWTVRNYRVYDDFLLLNSNAGYAMYSAQHPLHGTKFHEFGAAPIPEEWWGRTEAELDRDLMRLGVGFILDDPGRYLRLTLSRVRAFIEFWPTPDTTLLHNVGRTGSSGLLLPFLIFGLVLAFRREGFVRRNALLFLFVVFYTILHVLTWAMVRYRLPVEAALVPIAALSIAELIRKVRPRLALQAR